jgi:hypothetical protein
MRGANAIYAFFVISVLTVAAAWDTRFRIGFQCGDKMGCTGALQRPGNAAADLGSLVALIAIGAVGLIALMLVANGLVRLSRIRRRKG